jgi:hypothetical protein
LNSLAVVEALGGRMRADRAGVVLPAVCALVCSAVWCAALPGTASASQVRRLAPAHIGPVITATSPPMSSKGAVVFSDRFNDPGSGWPAQTLTSGTTLAYQGGRYVITMQGSLHHFANSPYGAPQQQLGLLVRGSIDAAGSSGSPGFGVVCRRGSAKTAVQYELFVRGDGRWFVERRDGGLSTTRSPLVLKSGSTSRPGPGEFEVEGVCATLGRSRVTRVWLFKEGALLADLSDRAPSLRGPGWLGGILASSAGSGQVVSFSRFEERDASR